MEQVKAGDTVKVHYHGRLTDGTTFDSSEGRDPLEFEVGGGMVIAGFDNGVLGMSVGDKRTVNIPVEEAYGPKNPEMIIEFPKDQVPDGMPLEKGMRLNLNNSQGQVVPVVVTDVQDDLIILDANHPLAGEALVFDIEVIGITPKPGMIIMP